MKIVAHRQMIIASIFTFLTGCVATSDIPCPPGHEQAINEQIYFGAAKPKGIVLAQEWTDFLRTAVTPRFPKGLTHWQAAGQWQGKNGNIVHENSYVLALIHPDDDKSEAAIRNIANEYKRRFQQEAVLRVKNFACVLY